MASQTPLVNFVAENWAAFLAHSISRGSYADLFTRDLILDPEWRDSAERQNVIDDFIAEAYPLLAIVAAGGGGGGAPTGAEYLTGATSGGLSAERVVTNTATLTWDLATAGQAKASVPAATTSAVGVVELATDGETAADKVVQGNDSRLANARTQPQVMAIAFGGS